MSLGNGSFAFYKFFSGEKKGLKFSAKTFLYAVYCAYIEIFFYSKPTKLKEKSLSCELWWWQQKLVNFTLFFRCQASTQM